MRGGPPWVWTASMPPSKPSWCYKITISFWIGLAFSRKIFDFCLF